MNDAHAYVNDIAEAAAWTDDKGVIIALRVGTGWSRCRISRSDAAILATQLQRLTARDE